MPIDGYTLYLLSQELKAKAVGARIEKIYQPSSEEIVFNLRSFGGALRLYFSASSNAPRVNITEIQTENPAVPPMLCMYMRKHLTGCIITDINQSGFDRLLLFELSGTNEIGDAVKFKIAFEMTPKHANFIIINSDDNIVECVKKLDYSPSTQRYVLPGFKYVMPPKQDKLNILTTETETIIDSIFSQKNKMLSSAVLSTLEGASPLISREAACRITGNDMAVSELTDIHKKNAFRIIDLLRKDIISGGTPTLVTDESGKMLDISFCDIQQYGFKTNCTAFNSYSLLIDKFYYEKNRTDRTGQQNKELVKTVSNLVARAKRKLDLRQNELRECSGKDKNRVFAELIMANQYSLKKGSLYYDLPDFYNNYETVRIKADPALSPSANAQKYFKEYNKLKNAEKLLDSLIKESEIEVEYLESVSDAIGRADGFSDIAEIKDELYEQGYLKKRNNKKGKSSKTLSPLEYISDDGYKILAGRNNIQNERLSFKTADKSDSWFHIQKFAGSHVVVIGNGDVIPELTCRQAAALAAYNSSARNSSRVAVDYTEVRELKKLSGGKPGMVIYHKYNTMWVTPDKELCERLRSK